MALAPRYRAPWLSMSLSLVLMWGASVNRSRTRAGFGWILLEGGSEYLLDTGAASYNGHITPTMAEIAAACCALERARWLLHQGFVDTLQISAYNDNAVAVERVRLGLDTASEEAATFPHHVAIANLAYDRLQLLRYQDRVGQRGRAVTVQRGVRGRRGRLARLCDELAHQARLGRSGPAPVPRWRARDPRLPLEVAETLDSAEHLVVTQLRVDPCLLRD